MLPAREGDRTEFTDAVADELAGAEPALTEDSGAVGAVGEVPAAGDVLGVARVAGIMASKRTADLVPLCHPIALTRVELDLDDALFTWQTMPLGPAVQMFRHDVAGEFQIMDIVDGELVPKELVKKMAPGGFGNREGAENQQSRRKTIGMKLR